MYLIALFPLVVFGLYKNGLSIYFKNVGDFGNALKPFILLASGLIGATAGGSLRECRKKTKVNKKFADKLKCDVVESLLVVAILPIESNPLIVFVVTAISSLFLEKIKLNKVALMYIVIEGLNVLLGLNNFNNIYEANTVLNYDGFDLFFGNGSGGIFSTNILFITIALIFLSFNKLYKKEMVYASLITFLVLGIVPNMVSGHYELITPFIFGYNILFILVFVAPNLYSSSYTIKGQILSGILIGILTYALSFWTPYTSAVLAVIATSILKGILDRMFVIK